MFGTASLPEICDVRSGNDMKHVIFVLLILVTAGCVTQEKVTRPTAPTRAETIAKDPYVGAIAVDAKSGNVLFEENADARIYPASVIKLMELLVILEKIQHGDVTLSATVTTTPEAARVGGSQVYLREGEQFTIDDLLYALTVQSANDAAVALATHLAGSKEAFVQQMNKRAAEIGMKSTHFTSVHGLPPARGETPDISTPRDLSLLARELLRHPETLRYTGCRERGFRSGEQSFLMRNHNHLLGTVEGCDGLKTGYFNAAGFSIVATATTNGRRIIAVVAGCRDRTTRDNAAHKLLTEVFSTESSKKDSANN